MIKLNKIYCNNCINLMRKIPDNYIDLTVTSPPYDNLRNYEGYIFEFEKIANELYRITKKGGIVVWIVGDATIKGSETGTSFRQALYFKQIGFNLHDTMIYSKSGFQYPSNIRYHQTFEYMFILSEGKPNIFNPIIDRKNKYPEGPWGKQTSRNTDGTLTEKNKNWKIKKFGKRYNVWYYANGKGNVSRDEIAYKHPAIFPEQLVKDHIISWSNEGDLVFDPMCGSGTTCKMAYLNNRNFIGCDISKKYAEIAKKRLQQYGWKENDS